MMTCFPVTWREALDHHETLPCTRILPGHGTPGGKKPEGFVQRRRAALPSFDGDVLPHHPHRFLFPKS